MTTGNRGHALDGRVFRRKIVIKAVRLADGRVELRSPGVGLWRGAPAPGTLVLPGSFLGELEVLGVLHELHADEHAHGLVLGESRGGRPARQPVGQGDLLCTLDPSVGAVAAVEDEAKRPWASGGLVFRSPSSGRFYGRAGPDKPPFVEVGSVLEEGTPMCLLEIMKTFHRINYGGAGLPSRARVKALLVADGADLETGDPIFELEV